MTDSISPKLGLDWGTSSFRLFELAADGLSGKVARSDRGVASFDGANFEHYLREQLDVLNSEGRSLVACGMIGSSLGWLDAGYVECPATIESIASALVQLPLPDYDAWLAPGLRCESPLGEPDVMRGEETQLFGWLAGHGNDTDVLVCLPGTHAKWTHVRGRCVETFITAPTGELFALLRGNSTLINGAQASSESAFLEGVDLARRSPRLSETLFATRSRALTGRLQSDHAAEFLSGLLIGSEVRSATERFTNVEHVVLIGDDALCDRYRVALATLGVESQCESGDDMVARGLAALHEMRLSR